MSKKRGPIDFPLFITILILLSIGVVMVFSASMVEDYKIYNDTYHHLKKQILWAFLGIFAMMFMANFDYRKLRNKKILVFGMMITIALLVIVLFMPARKGATRWIGIGGASIQPSELAKMILIIYLSDNIVRKGEKIKSFTKGVLPVLIIASFFAALIILEPNMSTTVIIMAIAFSLLFVGGAKIEQLVGIVLLGVAIAALGIIIEPYRMRRLTGFIDPFKDPLDSGYQAIQSLYALGSGGLFGMGLGQSRQKWHYIPEAQNDFIFSIICEELGYIGALFVIILFVILVWRGLKIAVTSRDKFGTLVAAGITSLMAVQSSINFLVVASFMPVTGVPLPLISYGGSSLVFTMALLGILLNISRYTVKNGVE